MRHLTTVALMLNLGIASLYAQQPAEEPSGASRIRMTFSGSTMSTTLAIAPDTLNHESHVAGNSSLGPLPIVACGLTLPARGPPAVAAAVSAGRFPLWPARGCFASRTEVSWRPSSRRESVCGGLGSRASGGSPVRDYQITGGTGRFRHAAASCAVPAADCTFQLTAIRGLVLRDSAGAPKFFMFTGEFQGTLPHFGNGDEVHSTSQGTEKDIGTGQGLCRISTAEPLASVFTAPIALLLTVERNRAYPSFVGRKE